MADVGEGDRAPHRDAAGHKGASAPQNPAAPQNPFAHRNPAPRGAPGGPDPDPAIPETVEHAKATLRRQVRAAVAALPPSRRALEEELVTAAIQDTPEWRAASTVLLYRSERSEFGTVGLVLAAWRAGKVTLFPRVIPDRQGVADQGITLAPASTWDGFAPGFRGMLEPVSPQWTGSPPDVALIPGAAFDVAGGRLGRGGGHYDRLLPTLACPLWGLAFDAQLVPSIPRAGHDQGVHRVWTGHQVGGPAWP